MTALVLVLFAAAVVPCVWFILLAELDRRGVFRNDEEV